MTSAACALAPSIGLLIAARCTQGAGAAVMLPASMALVREAFPSPVAGREPSGCGLIEGGHAGFGTAPVVVALAVAVLALIGYVLVQSRVAHPMMPSGRRVR